MKCPYCGNIDTKVVDSRILEENTAIRRRRQCDNCKERFTTYERMDNIPLIVIKRNGTRETFDRSKLLNGITISCNKRPVTLQDMESIVQDIERHIFSLMNKEIESKIIGELVMDRLKKSDEVSYVRFASVYKQFKDINTFMEELSQMKNEKIE